jgi:hypothetical protein
MHEERNEGWVGRWKEGQNGRKFLDLYLFSLSPFHIFLPTHFSYAQLASLSGDDDYSRLRTRVGICNRGSRERERKKESMRLIERR